MRALILGSSGQVAHCLMEQAPEAQAVGEALALGRPDVDLADTASMERALADFKPDIVINAAAYTAVDKAQSDAEAAFAVNRDGARAAAFAAAQMGARFVHLSTDFVFDGTKTTAYQEEDPAAPLGVYGQSKYQGERAVLAAHPEAVIVRLSWVYAARGHNFVKTMLRLATDRDEIGVVNDQRGRPSAADDVAAALWALAHGLMERPSPRRLYHLGPKGEASWAEFAARIMVASQAAGGPHAVIRPITTADYPTPAARPANAVLDCSRIQKDWGISLPDWQSSCDRVVRQIIASAQQNNRA